MKILVLGSGAREHAIIVSLLSEGAGHEVLAAPGNAGIGRVATLVDLDPNDPVAVTNFADDAGVNLVVIGPEAPLVAGVADRLRENGVPVFGPGRAAAQLEGSKAFAKRIMQAAGVPTGRALRAIRDHAMAAEAMGVDNRHYKSMAFGVSAAFTGVGGALSAIAVQYVSPDSFNLFLSISLLVGIVVGGIGTLWGALFGAVFIMFVPSLAESISKAAPWAIYGVVLIVLMFIMPGGVVGLFNKLTGRRSAA